MEDVGTLYVTIVCDWDGIECDGWVEVDYYTEDGTADSYSDFIPTSGTLIFNRN